ncbi:MAG TPA: hypothetical protein VF746_25000 [Longimicrobium sp.]
MLLPDHDASGFQTPPQRGPSESIWEGYRRSVQLGRILRHRIRQLASETSGGQLAEREKIEQMELLSKLLELHNHAVLGHHLKRFVLGCSTIVIFSLLLLLSVRRDEMEVFARVEATAARLTLKSTEVIPLGLKADSIGVAGFNLSPVDIGTSQRQALSASVPFPSQILVSGHGAKILVDRFVLPAATVMEVERTTSGIAIRLWCRNGCSSGEVSLTGIRPVLGTEKGIGSRDLILVPGSNGAALELFVQDSAIEFASEARIQKIAFQIEEPRGQNTWAASPDVSTIRSGELRLVDLNDRAVGLPNSSRFSMAGTQLSLAKLTFAPATGIFVVTGRARDVRVNSKDLKPTLLEWLSVRHPVKLLWISACTVIPLVIAAVRWLIERS